MSTQPLGWFGIVRLGLVQTALGAIVVLTTSTLNRVMVVELALPAMLPGLLVAIHYATQILRPRLGYGSDLDGRRTPWIVGGMAVLATGGVVAAVATAWMATNLVAGIALAVVAFIMIGVGVGASGTTLLVLLAKRVDESRRAAAATIVWVMMIAGFIITAAGAGQLLDPYSPSRLIAVSSAVSVAAFLLTLVAIYRVEQPANENPHKRDNAALEAGSFRAALAQVWSEPQARRFAIFVFVSMLAYSAQDLILEPFAGIVFGYSLGESTTLSGIQNGGVLTGMILVAIAGSIVGGRLLGSLLAWTMGGCIASAIALFGLAAAAMVGPSWPLRVSVFFLGLTNGAGSRLCHSVCRRGISVSGCCNSGDACRRSPQRSSTAQFCRNRRPSLRRYGTRVAGQAACYDWFGPDCRADDGDTRSCGNGNQF
jgi:BCD family chlorophyll transporter-like MFS transporter